MEYSIIKLREDHELKPALARWFHERWHISEAAYLQSMDECIAGKTVPQWYAVILGGQIIGGLGVIENDFHDRKDCTPNICAVFVDEKYRCRGVAGEMLQFVCDDMAKFGVKTLYLITDHDSFYERYGWEFFTYAQGDNDDTPSRLYVHHY